MRSLALASFAWLALAACNNDNPASNVPASTAKPEATATSATVAAAPSATPTSSANAPPAAPPACKISAQKSWAKNVNKVTGLTEIELPDGRVAIGFATGLDPQVLVVDKSGDGAVHKVAMKSGTHLATPPKASEGVRTLLRVTPVKVDGDKVQAFADYRDEMKDTKRMRVACGPADSDDAWISFDDVPVLDRANKPTGKAREELFKKKEADADEGYHELRDCRTFSDLKKNETWVIGSELRLLEGASETADTWKASLVVDRGSKSHETHLHENELKGAPPKLMNFEVPVSERAADGSYVLAARYGGALVVAVLNSDKTMKTMKTYPGWPTIADITQDGDDIVIATAFAKPNSKEFNLRAMRLSTKHPELPKELVPIVTDDDNVDSESAPDFTRDSKGRRWMTYVEGERGNGHFEIVPIDENFHYTSKPFEITTEEERASEGKVLALDDGSLLVAYLRQKDKDVELVTLDLSCEPPK